MMKTTKMKLLGWPIHIGLVALSLLFLTKVVSGYLWGNVGFLRLVDGLTSESDSANSLFIEQESIFRQSMTLRRNTSSAYRGLGFVYWHQGRDALALDHWRHAGFTSSDYVKFGQQAESTSESLRWYRLAEQMEPANHELWLHVGQICQRDPAVADICDRFLAYNENNWLVDPDFAFDRQAWSFNRREGASYAITACPDEPDIKCARVQIHTVRSPHGTSWQQCLTLVPGQAYRFSVWVKADTEGQWIPLYLQGDIDGDPHGVKLGGSYTGNQDWTYFEEDYVIPEFDDQHACFYPLRLLDMGSAWFHSAELRPVERMNSDE